MTSQNKNGFNFRQFSISATFAALINGAIYLIGSAAGASMVINQNGTAMEIALPMVIAVTFLALVGAGAIANLIAKRSPNFVPKFAFIGLILGILSIVAPIQGADDTGTAISLAANHLTAAIFWYLGVKKACRNN